MGDYLKQQYDKLLGSKMSVYEQMERLAKKKKVELTENAFNIARFRERTGLPLDKCPCAPLDKERGCISKKCLDEINNFGTCHCQAYKKSIDKK